MLREITWFKNTHILCDKTDMLLHSKKHVEEAMYAGFDTSRVTQDGQKMTMTMSS